MAKLLGNDVVTTAEFETFKKQFNREFRLCAFVGSILTLINLGLVVYVLIR